MTLLLAGSVLLQAAAMQPAVINGTREARRYNMVLDSGVTYAMLATVLMVVAWRARRDAWRVGFAVALILASVAGGSYALGLIHEPGVAGGMGLRGLLGTYAIGCSLLAGILLLLAYEGRSLFSKRKVIASGLVALIGVAGLLAIPEIWFPPVVEERNLAVTPAAAVTPATPAIPPWWPAYPTTGGRAVPTSHGVLMLDPKTGALRWSYERYDAVRVEDIAVSLDGDVAAVTTVLSTTSSVFARAQETRYIWVFATPTGELLASCEAGDLDVNPQGAECACGA